MGLKNMVDGLFNNSNRVLTRPAEVYNAATNIFTLTGGAIWIKTCVLRATAAAGGATTLATTWNGVAGEAAGVDIGTGTIVGEVVTVPLNVAAVIPGSLGAIPQTDALLYPKGMIMGLGAAGIASLVIFTFAVSTWTGTISVVWQALEPGSSLTISA